MRNINSCLAIINHDLKLTFFRYHLQIILFQKAHVGDEPARISCQG